MYARDSDSDSGWAATPQPDGLGPWLIVHVRHDLAIGEDIAGFFNFGESVATDDSQ